MRFPRMAGAMAISSLGDGVKDFGRLIYEQALNRRKLDQADRGMAIDERRVGLGEKEYAFRSGPGMEAGLAESGLTTVTPDVPADAPRFTIGGKQFYNTKPLHERTMLGAEHTNRMTEIGANNAPETARLNFQRDQWNTENLLDEIEGLGLANAYGGADFQSAVTAIGPAYKGRLGQLSIQGAIGRAYGNYGRNQDGSRFGSGPQKQVITQQQWDEFVKIGIPSAILSERYQIAPAR